MGSTPDAALRLAALAVFVAEDAARLAERLRLSNAEQAVLLLGASDHERAELPDEAAARRALYRLGPCKFEAHVLLASADEGGSPDDQRWRQALRLADRWQAPEFPLRGPDIMALGEVKGPEIGDMLRRLEADWIASDFTLDRDAAARQGEAASEGLTRRARSRSRRKRATRARARSRSTRRVRAWCRSRCPTLARRNSRKLVSRKGQRGSCML